MNVHRLAAVGRAWRLWLAPLLLLQLSAAPAVPAAAVAAVAAPAGVTRYAAPSGSDASPACALAQPCQTVQRAVTVAQAGDEIHVAAGTYGGTMFDGGIDAGVTATVIVSKAIAALRGGYSADFSNRDPVAYPTVLSASGSPGAHVLLLSGINTVVEGFTLTGASGACSPGCGTQYYGGAVRIRGGAPVLSGNRIDHNAAHQRGGGIYVGEGAAPTISANVISDNSSDASGGGIYVQSANALINGNQILSNTAAYEGGGIYIDSNVPAVIRGNAIGFNLATNPNSSGGGGVRTVGGSAVVTIIQNDIFSNGIFGGGAGLDIWSQALIDRNLVHDNWLQAGGWGGAIMLGAVTQPVTVTNNVIYANHGSAVQSVNSTQVAFINNTVADNVHVQPDSGTEADAYLIWFDAPPGGPVNMTVLNNILANNENCGLFYHNAPAVVSANNDAWNNAHDAANYCEGASAGPGDISANPLFANPGVRDYHLALGSPAIDSGASLLAPGHDKDCDLRPYGPGVDMGAYERWPSLQASGPSQSAGSSFRVYLPVILIGRPLAC